MMFDWLTGTRRPAPGVGPARPEAVYRALLGVNRSTGPFLVRPCIDADGEDADLVGEWRLTDPLWYAVFGSIELEQFQVFMRLRPEVREVRTIDRKRDLTAAVGGPGLSWNWSRGTFHEVRFRSPPFVETTPEGARFAFRFSNAELKTPLRAAVVAQGWTWRAAAWRL